MSIAALDLLTTAQTRLVAALDGGDIAEIEAASQALAREIDQVRAVPLWNATPALEERARTALRTGDGARIRLGYLADRGRRRLQVLLGLSGKATVGYGRDGRIHLPKP